MDDAPVGYKLGLIVLLAFTLGMGAAEIVALSRTIPIHPAHVLVAGTLVVWLLYALVKSWITGPLSMLLNQLDKVNTDARRQTVKQLELERDDEMGRIAREVQKLGYARLRSDLRERVIRRTMDAEIDKATREATEKLRRLAYRDPLTGVGNRLFFQQHAEPLVRLAGVRRTPLVCVAIDIDGFKEVNDTLGHAAGDQVLVLLGTLLRCRVRATDLVARLGGDEFVMMLTHVEPGQVEAMIRSTRALFEQQGRVRFALPDDADGPRPALSFSAGIMPLDENQPQEADVLLHHADTLLYQAKHEGRGLTCVATGKVA